MLFLYSMNTFATDGSLADVLSQTEEAPEVQEQPAEEAPEVQEQPAEEAPEQPAEEAPEVQEQPAEEAE